MTHPVLRAVGAATAAGAACFAYGLVEARCYTVRKVAAEVLPPGGRPLRVLHISDIHLLARQAGKLDFVRKLAELEPDLVVNTGDNLSQASAVAPLLQAFEPLSGVPGVFVFGSNDYLAPRYGNPFGYLIHGRSRASDRPRVELPWEELRDGMIRLGWHDLTHQRVKLAAGGYELAFRGTDDPHLRRDRYELVAGPADPTAELNIGVTHAPYLRVLDAMAADQVDLILAGHTHGGQVCVPGYGALVTNCDIDAARVKGLSSHTNAGQRSFLHVSAGLGTSPFAPYRFACRPEATVLTLQPRSR